MEVRMFTDHALTEAYFQQGRVAMTVPLHVPFDHATVVVGGLPGARYLDDRRGRSCRSPHVQLMI